MDLEADSDKIGVVHMKIGTFAGIMAKVGCIGFGGGSALIPVIEDAVVGDGKLDSKENYDKDVVVASITPGALPVKIAGALGRRNFGRKGMVIGAAMMALPGALGALLMFTLLSAMQSVVLREIKIVSVGISAFIISLLIQYITNVVKQAGQESRRRLLKTYFAITIVFILNCGKNLYNLLGIDRKPIFGFSSLQILLAVFVIAAIRGITDMRRFRSRRMQSFDKKNLTKDLIVWVLFAAVFLIPVLFYSAAALSFAGKGWISAWISFGGGDAYLTIADGLFVESGILSAEIYYGQIVPVVNILPGSILCKTLLGIGYYLGYSLKNSAFTGILFGLVGFAVSIAASCSSFGIVSYLYDSMADSEIFSFVSRWVRPVIAGFLLNIMLSLCCQNKGAVQYTDLPAGMILIVTVVLAVINYLLEKSGKVRKYQLILLDLLAAVVLL